MEVSMGKASQQQKEKSWGLAMLLRRVFLGLPLLGLSLLAMKAMNVGPIIPVFQEFQRGGEFNLNGHKLQLPRAFYHIDLMDNSVGVLVAFFTQMIAGFDRVTYWQTFTFITDYCGLYAVLLMESWREANIGTPMQFPDIFVILAQVRGIGILGPIYFFLSYIITPMSKLEVSQHRQMKLAPLNLILPVTFIGYLVPHFLSYHDPSVEMRPYWNTIWQPFPIWISLLMMILSLTSRQRKDSAALAASYLPATRTIGYYYVLLSSVVFLSTRYYSKLSLAMLFIPDTLSPSTDVVAAVRSCLQWDQICSFGAGFVWLGLTFADINYSRKGVKLWPFTHWAPLVLLGLIVLGPGAVFVGLWMIREELLAHETGHSMEIKSKGE